MYKNTADIPIIATHLTASRIIPIPLAVKPNRLLGTLFILQVIKAGLRPWNEAGLRPWNEAGLRPWNEAKCPVQ